MQRRRVTGKVMEDVGESGGGETRSPLKGLGLGQNGEWRWRMFQNASRDSVRKRWRG